MEMSKHSVAAWAYLHRQMLADQSGTASGYGSEGGGMMARFHEYTVLSAMQPSMVKHTKLSLARSGPLIERIGKLALTDSDLD